MIRRDFRGAGTAARLAAGVSLVELMISLVLGLLVVGAALTVFISNKQTYAATESLSRIQESGRIAFELMTRDLREAGGTGCERDLPIVNVLNSPAANWWSQWNSAVRGFESSVAFPDVAFGTGAGERVSGTDAVEIRSAISNGVTVDSHQPDSAQFKANTADHGIHDGDIVMVCDFDHAAILQVTNAQPGTNTTIVHNTGTGTPGNATKCLALNGVCPNGAVKTYAFGCFEGKRQGTSCVDPRNWPAKIAKLEAWRWYIGNNARGGRSLFRTGLRNAAGTPGTLAIEVAENVTGMEIGYLVDGSTTYVDSDAVAAWPNVISVRIQLQLSGTTDVGTDNQPLRRTIQHVVALRNRAQ
jgi:type IV pilus assembly protein PilW